VRFVIGTTRNDAVDERPEGRALDGVVKVDVRGTAPGRGAYVCLTPGCVEGNAVDSLLVASLRRRSVSARERRSLDRRAPGSNAEHEKVSQTSGIVTVPTKGSESENEVTGRGDARGPKQGDGDALPRTRRGSSRTRSLRELIVEAFGRERGIPETRRALVDRLTAPPADVKERSSSRPGGHPRIRL
jgi:hypothetical protein